MSSSPASRKRLLRQRIKEASTDGVITCATIRRIAEEVRVTYKEAGEAANRLKIKIRNCDLGCF